MKPSKFELRVGSEQKIYLGTFDSLEAAKAAAEDFDRNVGRLLAFVQAKDIDPTKAPRGWGTIGQIDADAVMQRQNNYETRVEPRVRQLPIRWAEDVKTLEGVQRQIDAEDVEDAIGWHRRKEEYQPRTDRISVFEGIVGALRSLGISTRDDLLVALACADKRHKTRAALATVPGVGCKTLDYFDILVGLPATAIDDRILNVAKAVGLIANDAFIDERTYDHLKNIIVATAESGGWDLRNLDHALWEAGGNLNG
jgi:hypothetical protein